MHISSLFQIMEHQRIHGIICHQAGELPQDTYLVFTQIKLVAFQPPPIEGRFIRLNNTSVRSCLKYISHTVWNRPQPVLHDSHSDPVRTEPKLYWSRLGWTPVKPTLTSLTPNLWCTVTEDYSAKCLNFCMIGLQNHCTKSEYDLHHLPM
jgi:hypothetical protein